MYDRRISSGNFLICLFETIKKMIPTLTPPYPRLSDRQRRLASRTANRRRSPPPSRAEDSRTSRSYSTADHPGFSSSG